MPSALASLEIVLVVVLVLVLLGIAAVFVRRRAIARGTTLTLCGLRSDGSVRWRLGLARLGGTELEWFALVGATLRPAQTWTRGGLDLAAPVVLQGLDRIDLLPDAVGVQCSHEGDEFDLALQPPAYTALRSWLESAPPGSRRDVA